MSDPLPNPYEHELPPEQLELGRGAAWVLTVVFLVLLGAPSIWQEIREWSRDQGWIPASEFLRAVRGIDAPTKPIADRLHGFETSLEQHQEWATSLRQVAQQQLSQWLAAGNHKVVEGRDGWLFYRPEINALTGYGPLQKEPHSVASDPEVANWEPPLGAILDFADQLKSRGIELWMVPVPMKESIYPEMIGRGAAKDPVVHPDQAAFYGRLSAHGITVIELDKLFWQRKSLDHGGAHVYLRQDTHWSPHTMVEVADLLAEKLSQRLSVKLLGAKSHGLDNEFFGVGDLAEKLDLGLNVPAQERVWVQQPGETKSDPNAPVTLLGDSFVNIYRDPGLGFGERAGLGEHLIANLLDTSLEIIAINGGGASQVRERFMSKPAAELRQKKVVVWVLAARDIFLNRTDALANQVIWKKVAFPPADLTNQGPKADFTSAAITATVLEISPVGSEVNPQLTTYANAIVAVKYRVDQVIAGELDPQEVTVYQWLFRQRVWQPASKLKVGQQVSLKLLPWTEAREAYSVNQFDDLTTLERYWAE